LAYSLPPQLKLCSLLSATTEFTNCSTPKTKVSHAEQSIGYRIDLFTTGAMKVCEKLEDISGKQRFHEKKYYFRILLLLLQLSQL